ncbi:hypothetical protein [Blastopirellula retiformator]|uniref:Uncharacterized protein n=1 Tax=Blastopirellula retiformator TaxID=2527970 RepID=A0A5C5UYH5_9BACT|nr:hypothetical protein [Blastopirellula retiformator]TWT30693.1 hypothetical protein Enr8_42160 [Blastopirellula retiformator]
MLLNILFGLMIFLFVGGGLLAFVVIAVVAFRSFAQSPTRPIEVTTDPTAGMSLKLKNPPPDHPDREKHFRGLAAMVETLHGLGRSKEDIREVAEPVAKDVVAKLLEGLPDEA